MEPLARLAGRDISVPILDAFVAPGLRFGKGPKESRDTPDVLSRGTCLLLAAVLLLRKSDACDEGVSSPATLDEALEPTVRLRLLIVTVDGTPGWGLGDIRGGVFAPPGSFDRAE